jgi:hypothetical protein
LSLETQLWHGENSEEIGANLQHSWAIDFVTLLFFEHNKAKQSKKRSIKWQKGGNVQMEGNEEGE